MTPLPALLSPLPALQTKLALVVFFLAYMAFLTRSAARHRIDIYDYLALSCVAMLPLFFGLFPETTLRLSHLLGVEFPFVVLFGLLFLAVFAYLHHLLNRLNAQTILNAKLVQELSLLKHSVEKLDEKPNLR